LPTRTPSRISLVTMLVTLVLVACSGVAAANSGPPTMAGDKSGLLLPGKSSQMHVLREYLRFDLSKVTTEATVSARYEMENRGQALKDYAVIFVWQARRGASASPVVTWNGQPVRSQILDLSPLSGAELQQMETAWSAMDEVADPVTGEMVEFRSYEGNRTVTFLGFSLDVPANSTGVLQVTYEHAAAMDKTTGYLHPVYAYQYLLLPAKSWASFGPLEIEVKAPGPDESFFKSNLPLTWDGEAYRASLPGLPDQNLAFSLMSRKGVIGNWSRPAPYYWLSFLLLLAACALLGLGLGWLAGFIRHRTGAVVTALGVSLFGCGLGIFILAFGFMALFPALSSQGYGVAFAAVGETVVGTVLAAVLASVYAGRRSKRRLGISG